MCERGTSSAAFFLLSPCPMPLHLNYMEGGHLCHEDYLDAISMSAGWR
jgi:hypothetical protein